MLVTSLLTFAIALFAFYISMRVTDEIVQLAVALPALLCLFFSLAITPWPLKLLLAIALLVSKKHTQALIHPPLKVQQNQETDCPLALAFALAQRQDLLDRCLAQPASETLERNCAIPCCYALRKN